MANTSSRSSCHKTDSLKGTANVMLTQQPYLTDLLLVKAGDVELNPGPLYGSIDSVLQESELILLADEVPGNCYKYLCIGLGFSLDQSRNVLTQHHMNLTGALTEFFCGWKIKQKDGTNCRALLGEILKNANMGALQKKLLTAAPLRVRPPSAHSPQAPPGCAGATGSDGTKKLPNSSDKVTAGKVSRSGPGNDKSKLVGLRAKGNERDEGIRK